MTYFPRIVKTAGGVTGTKYDVTVTYEIVRVSDNAVVATRTAPLNLSVRSIRKNLEIVRDDMEAFLVSQAAGDPLQVAKTMVANMTDADWQRYGI